MKSTFRAATAFVAATYRAILALLLLIPQAAVSRGLVLCGSSFPNGTIFSVGTAYAAAKTITAITNANPGAASSTAHGYTDGDILLLTMPSRLDQRPVRVIGSATNTFNLEGIDTTSTTLYPAGFGVGSSSKVTSFVPMSQVTDSVTNGGDQQFYQWVYMDDGRQRQRPTFKNARSLQLTLDWDPTLAWHNALIAADLAQTPYVLLASLPSGVKLYYGVYVSYDGEPGLKINENIKTVATFSFANPSHTRY